MANNEKREAMEQAQYDVNCAKERLMNVMYELEDAGAIRKANSLRTIIEKLERWQHTR